jgi:hypothetical protein
MVRISSNRVSGISDIPLEGTDGINQNYVDEKTWKTSVKACSVIDITIDPAQTTIDGITITENNRVLLNEQVTNTENGIYKLLSGVYVRTNDAEAIDSASGVFVYVNEGTENGDSLFHCPDELNFNQGVSFIKFGSGGVNGPDISVNNTIPIFEGVTGKILKSSDVEIDGSGNMSKIKSVRLEEPSGTEYVSLNSSNLSSSYSLTFPESIGTVNQILSTGSTPGIMEWVNNNSGSSNPGGPPTSIQFNNAGSFGGVSSLTWAGTTLTVLGTINSASSNITGTLSALVLDSKSITLEDPGAPITKITLTAKTGTNAYTLIFPGTIGTAGQVLSTGTTVGTMEWKDNYLPPGGANTQVQFNNAGAFGGSANLTWSGAIFDVKGTIASKSLTLEDTGAPITKVTLNAKAGTSAYTLILPGTVGAVKQVLSTGSTAGIMEWITVLKSGDVLDGASLLLEDPGAPTTKVTINAKAGTNAYTLILPGTVGTTNQVLSTGTTPGTMEWKDNYLPPGGPLASIQFNSTADFGGSANLTWSGTTLKVIGTVASKYLTLEDPGAPITTVTIGAKAGTNAYTLILPGTVGVAGQVLSTGATAGVMEWKDNYLPPGGANTQVQFNNSGAFGGSSNLTWSGAIFDVKGTMSIKSLTLEDPGAAVTKVTINSKVGTTAYTLILPGTVGTSKQFLSTGTVPGTTEWITAIKPGDALDGSSLLLEDPGVPTTKVTINAKAGTNAYTLILPGTIGLANQVLSTGTTVGTMEWKDNYLPPGGPLASIQFNSAADFGGSANLTWSGTTLSVVGTVASKYLTLEDPGAPITTVTIGAKAGTNAYTLILPGTVGVAGQVLSTGATAGVMEWKDNYLPPGGANTQVQFNNSGAFGGSSNLTWSGAIFDVKGTMSIKSLTLEDPGAAVTKVTINSKVGTTAYTLILPGTVGTSKQFLSTGTVPGTTEWITAIKPGDALDGSSLLLEDPGVPTTKVTINAKAGTNAYTLILPGTIGLAGQVLSTGTTVGTMEWKDNYLPPGGANTQVQFNNAGDFGGSANLTWSGAIFDVKGTMSIKSLTLEDTGAPITKVTLNAKAGTSAYTLILPGTVGAVKQVLSTGTTPGTMEWLNVIKPGDVLDGSSLLLKDPGAPTTKVTINAKAGTSSYTLILPGTTGLSNQVLSTGTTPGTMEWKDNYLPPGGPLTSIQFNSAADFGGSANLTWAGTTLKVIGTVASKYLTLEDPGAPITTVTIGAKAGTAAYTLILPGTVGVAGQVLSTGATAGVMEWKDNYLPPGGINTQVQFNNAGAFGGSANLTWSGAIFDVKGTMSIKSLTLEDPGAAVTKVTINASASTAAYSLNLPVAVGTSKQFLSTGTVPGTMQWITAIKPGDALDGSSLLLEDPGAPTTKVTINAKAGTAAYTLILPGTIGTAGQVLSTGTTAGTMEWKDNYLPPGGANTQVQFNNAGGFGGSANLTWSGAIFDVKGTIASKSLTLEDTGAPITKITLNAKAGTSAYTLILPGTVGAVKQVLSTGTTPGTMEWLTVIKPGDVLDGSSLLLKDPGAPTTKVTINAKAGTSAYTLILPGTVGASNQVLSTGTTPGTMEWKDNYLPPGGPLSSIQFNSAADFGGSANLTWAGTTLKVIGTVASKYLTLEDPGAPITTVTIGAKAGTAAYTLILPGTVGVAGQVLSTGATAGVMEWKDNYLPPGGINTQVQFNNAGAFGGSANLTWSGAIFDVKGTMSIKSLTLEDPGAAVTKVTINASASTAAYTLNLPVAVGASKQFLSTGTVPGTMQWITAIKPGDALDGSSLLLEDPGAPTTKVTINAKAGTAAYTLILPGTLGTAGQVLSTGTTVGTMEWKDNYLPPGGANTQVQFNNAGAFGGSANLTWSGAIFDVKGTIASKSLTLEDTGAPITKVTLNAKAGTAAYTLILPGTVGAAGQVLSTGATAGTMEWVNKMSPGGALAGTSLILEDPGAPITTVTLTAKAATAAYTLILPGTVGTANQVLSTGATAGTMEWKDNFATPGGATTQVQFNNAGLFGGSSNLTWSGSLLNVTGSITCSSGMTCDKIVTSNKGSVSQLVSLSTAVTINSSSGTIDTYFSVTGLASKGSEDFQVNNTYISANSVIMLTAQAAQANTEISMPLVTIKSKTSGSFIITLTNVNVDYSFTEQIKINFIVF